MLDINISTILLQMANFFILVFILYRFLFKPLQNVMRKREIETNRVMDEATVALQNAEEMRRQYEEKTDNIDAVIAARRNEARIVIERNRQEMLKEVQSEIEDLKSQNKDTLMQMRAEAVQQHKEQMGFLATEFAKGILKDLMTPDLQKSYQDAFLNQLGQMNLSKYLEGAAPGEASLVRVIFAKEPAASYQEELSSVIHQKLSQEISLSYEVDPRLIAGGILRFENELIDGSLQGQVNHFQKRYQEIA
ncbi:MAG: F0F1 ATP synthase subunit delta [Chloroflexota bacterium]|nr:F0F1 ATP synthase subunit delta [Chloroflexota bacterium]